MKKRIQYLFVFLFLIAGSSFSQAPQAFKYQAVARNSSGMLLNNANLTVRVGLRDVSVTGAIVYQETHAVTTNSFGLLNLSVGKGSVTSGTFTSINWAAGDKFIEIEIDYGTGFISMGISQLLSVPYALYAASGNPGPIGPQGPQGPQGIQGPQGVAGPAGGPLGSAILPTWQFATTSTTINPTTDFVQISHGGTYIYFTLPLASSVPQGKILIIKRTRVVASVVTANYQVNAQGSDMIVSWFAVANNAQVYASGNPYENGIIRLISDGVSNWYEW